MQYLVNARVARKANGEVVRNFIETDSKPRAIHLANVFRNNGWSDVRIEVGGQEFHHPWGDVP